MKMFSKTALLVAAALAGVFTIAGAQAPYTLPQLNYAYNALEPFIDAQTMEIHHSRHHQAYVNNLNAAVKGTNAEKLTIEDLMISAGNRSDAVRNNAGGVYNHSLFWEILSPKAQKDPQGNLFAAIQKQFVSVDSLKKALTQAGATRFGSGWAWLIVTPEKKLAVCSTPNQDNPIMNVSKDRGIPILAIDVWEHAYYLKYQNKRGDYLSAIWNVLDWSAVAAKYEAALTSPLLKRIELDTWSALNDFHKVMSQTFHPMEEGKFEPIRTRSAEMLMKAKLVQTSAIPASFNTPEIKKAITDLVKGADDLNKAISKKAKDDVIKTKLTALHDVFHSIQELCND